MKWVYLTTAPNEWSAHIWRGILMEEEIPCMFRGGDVNPFLGSSSFPCRLLVEESRREEALEILRDRVELPEP